MLELKVTKQDLKQLELKGDVGMQDDFKDTISAVRLFINSQVTESENALQSKYGKSLIHTHGTTVLSVLKGLMTVIFVNSTTNKISISPSNASNKQSKQLNI